MYQYDPKIIRPQSTEETLLIKIAAVGHGISPLEKYCEDHNKIPRLAKRKFRKLWRKAKKYLLANSPNCTEELNHYIASINKTTLVRSALLSEEKKKLFSYTNHKT